MALDHPVFDHVDEKRCFFCFFVTFSSMKNRKSAFLSGCFGWDHRTNTLYGIDQHFCSVSRHLFLGPFSSSLCWGRETYGYGSIPINTIFSGMNIHLPAILMFTRGTRF